MFSSFQKLKHQTWYTVVADYNCRYRNKRLNGNTTDKDLTMSSLLIHKDTNYHSSRAQHGEIRFDEQLTKPIHNTCYLSQVKK